MCKIIRVAFKLMNNRPYSNHYWLLFGHGYYLHQPLQLNITTGDVFTTSLTEGRENDAARRQQPSARTESR